MANIKDVARYANVSTTTVSHVLNGRGRVAEETRDRVLEAAARLGYTANAHARQLVTRRSRILGIQMPDLDPTGEGATLMPTSESEYFLELINGAAAAAAAVNYALIVVSPGVDASSMQGFGVDGMILVDPKGSEAFLQASFTDRYPVVTTGEPVVSAGRPCFIVDNDHAAATHEVLNHFASQGCSHPAIIVDTTSRSYIRDIQHAYNDWCNLNDVRPVVLAVPDASPGQMRRALTTLRSGSSPVDAIYTSSDECAVALLNAARQSRISVPEDLALASAVDSSILRVTNPPVTGVFLHPREIGARAVESVTELISRKDPECQLPPIAATRTLIATKLITRTSTEKKVSR